MRSKRRSSPHSRTYTIRRSRSTSTISVWSTKSTTRPTAWIPVNIYDLGLVYEIDYTPDGVATIRMTLTAPNCPMADMLVEDVNQQVAKVKGVKSVNVILTFDPVWDKSMMSEEALLELNML